MSDSDAKSKDKKGMEAGWNLGTESLVNMEVKVWVLPPSSRRLFTK